MDFKKAIAVALASAKDLLPGAKQFNLEGAVIAGGDYEITLSYFLTGEDPLDLKEDSTPTNSLFKIAKLMGTRREYKVFIVNRKTLQFKGFRAYKESQ
ncbi:MULTISPECIES: hypothetical protein [unclassified Massilia]|uniref:hypothetical protein n=1 Tax=unclassified Massilia TaxID=2609279 RepID=UPI0017838CFF|nr:MULTISPECIES: hypothetical protein [unclassified Massilia]MBD8533073.1 hypothetical protein [Massilia sp. CFBP 13647]MBD8676570.1 hypothetical protein [Massilia sp. CFBP 13721]